MVISMLVTVPYIRFMDRDKGPIVLWAGNVGMYFINGLGSDIFFALEPLFNRGGFNGVFEMDLIVYEKEFKITAFKPYITPTFYTYAELLAIPLSEFFVSLNQEARSFRMGKVATSVMLSLGELSVPDCVNITPQAIKHFWELAHPIIGWSTAWGKDLVESHRRAYRTINNIVRSPEVQYREDIGFKKVNAEDVLFILKEWGWIDATIRRKEQKSVSNEYPGTPVNIQEDKEDREQQPEGYGEGAEAGVSDSL